MNNNPSQVPLTATPDIVSGDPEKGTVGTVTSGVSNPGQDAIPLVRHVLSQELIEYYERVTDAIRVYAATDDDSTSSLVQQSEQQSSGWGSAATSSSSSSAKPSVPVVQMQSSDVLKLALQALSQDPGLQSLVPYFVDYISNQVLLCVCMFIYVCMYVCVCVVTSLQRFHCM